jgi:superfamily I DNA/RNA helicase
VSTFHAWARAALADGDLRPRFQAGTPDPVVRLKQHAAIDTVLAAHVRRLGRRLVQWLPVPDELRDAWETTEGEGFVRLRTFFEAHPVPRLARRVRRRLGDHLRDLRAALGDEDRLASALPPELRSAAVQTAKRERDRMGQALVDFADAALLLRIGQLKARAGAPITVPWRGCFAHIVVDEAQDLSVPELRAILDAADVHRSVTIAGDPAQMLYGSGAFDLLGGGASELEDGLVVDTLGVGHRSTRQIMALALKASGRTDDALLARTRPGHPVVWLDAADPSSVADHLRRFAAHRPNALVAVLCHDKRAADQWAADLRATGLPRVRRAHRTDFVFDPGVLVSNVHQVKGLEFDGVVLVDPAAYRDRERNLLHVAITRAADRLWVVGRRGMLA